MKYDGIIFDIDGTLWSAVESSAKGFNKGLESLNVKDRVTAEDVARVTGKPYKEVIETLFPNLDKEHPNLAEVLDRYELDTLKKEGGSFYPDVIDGIKKLSKESPIYLVSNCQDFYMNLFLDLSGLKSFISDYDCNGMSNLSKGEMIKQMTIRNKIDNPVYIGDTSGDERAAKEADTDFIYVSYGFGKTKNECKTFDTFANLIDYLIAF
jgi:phosphoglycolate phosphatase